jgi:hypothetical protein
MCLIRKAKQMLEKVRGALWPKLKPEDYLSGPLPLESELAQARQLHESSQRLVKRRLEKDIQVQSEFRRNVVHDLKMAEEALNMVDRDSSNDQK